MWSMNPFTAWRRTLLCGDEALHHVQMVPSSIWNQAPTERDSPTDLTPVLDRSPCQEGGSDGLDLAKGRVVWGHHFPKTNVIVHRAPKGSVGFTLKFWNKRRQSCVLGSVYAQGPQG